MAADEPVPASADKKKETARWFGMRRAALVELALFFGGLLIVDELFFGGTRFWATEPHPFWIAVLLISVQYGTNEALLAAALASAILLVGNLPEQGLTQDFYDYLFEVSRRPVLWFAAAIVVGELRMRQIREREKLHEDVAAAREREQTLIRAYESVRAVKTKLESHIAGQLRSVISTFRAAQGIDRSRLGQVILGSRELVTIALDPVKYSIFAFQDDVLSGLIQQGWTPEDHFATSFGPDSELFRRIVGERRMLCIADAKDEPALAGQGLLAGPLVDAHGGGVIGMLKIEGLNFIDLNFSTLETFRAVCEWIGTALGNSLRFEAAASDSIFAAETQLLSSAMFARQTNFLASLARRVGFDVSMVVLRVDNADDLTLDQRKGTADIIHETVGRLLRTTDLAFDYKRAGWEYALVLPNTPEAGARLVADKIVLAATQRLAERGNPGVLAAHVEMLAQADQPPAAEG